MATYQAVQAEIDVDGSLVSLQTGASTPTALHQKIKCGLCGASFVRNTRRNRAKTSQLGGVTLSTAAAQTNVKVHAVPPARYARDVLKKKCAKVLGAAGVQ